LCEDRTEQWVLKQILKLRDDDHKSWSEVSDAIELDLAIRGGRRFKKSAFYHREWPAQRCRRAYASAQRLDGPELPQEVNNRG
jgi:hypothetical protein